MNPKNKLKTAILVAIILFILHGIEEYLTGFYKIDPLFITIAQNINIFSLTLSAKFIIFQFIFWLLLIIAFAQLKKEKTMLWFTILFSIIAFFELEHIVNALLIKTYYPGAITSLLFPSIILLSISSFLCFRCCKDYCINCKSKKPLKKKIKMK